MAAQQTPYERIKNKTQGILFLGVPHFGSRLWWVAALMSCATYWRGSSTALLETLTLNNSRLIELDEDFKDKYTSASHTSVYIGNFLEAQGETLGDLYVGPVSHENRLSVLV